MYKTIIKKIGSVCLLLTISTVSFTENWHNTLSKYSTQCCIAGTITALIIGKLSYDYYRTHVITHEQFIENCQILYQKINSDVEYYHHFYQSDVQISDWELKEIILYNNQETYPFMTYYTVLTQAYGTLKKHLICLNNQLTLIDKYKRQLLYKKKSETINHLEELLLQLKTKGKHIQEYTIKTMTLVSILKSKIKLSKEYNDDCYNWAHAQQNSYPNN